MKKFALILFALGINVIAGAQRQNVQSAMNSYNDKDYDKALSYIEKAVKDPSTEKDPKAWMWRGNIYSMMQKDPVKAPTNPYREAAVSYLKVVQLKPDYEKDAISTGLVNCMYQYYNDAVKAYNDSKFEDAMNYMKRVNEIAGLDNNKRFGSIKQIDTINTEAKFIAAKSARFLQKNDDALPLFIELKNNPIVKKGPEIYAMIIDIYRDKNMDKELLATIEEAKKEYPNDDAIRTKELNYYIKNGKQADLLKKLEENAAKDPNNKDISYDLATFYQNMAFPKDGKKPSNYDELIAKAEAAFQNALRIDPENTGYHYNLGALYFNIGKDYNDQRNSITGTSKAETQKYDEVTKQRDAMLEKAVPHFEKIYNALDPKAATLTAEDKSDYQNTLLALKQVYAIQNKMAQSAEMKKKLDAYK